MSQLCALPSARRACMFSNPKQRVPMSTCRLTKMGSTSAFQLASWMWPLISRICRATSSNRFWMAFTLNVVLHFSSSGQPAPAGLRPAGCHGLSCPAFPTELAAGFFRSGLSIHLLAGLGLPVDRPDSIGSSRIRPESRRRRRRIPTHPNLTGSTIPPPWQVSAGFGGFQIDFKNLPNLPFVIRGSSWWIADNLDGANGELLKPSQCHLLALFCTFLHQIAPSFGTRWRDIEAMTSGECQPLANGNQRSVNGGQ